MAYKSPYPPQSDMDLDMVRAQPTTTPNEVMLVGGERGTELIGRVYSLSSLAEKRMAMVNFAKRIEMMGDLYEELRQLEERAFNAGLDTSQARAALQEFVTPKPSLNAEG